MSIIDNLFDEDILMPNLHGSSYFVLIYEHFEDLVINTVRNTYGSDCVLDGKLWLDIDKEYIDLLMNKIKNGERDIIPYDYQLNQSKNKLKKYNKEIRDAVKENDGKILKGSLNWFEKHGVFSDQEKERILSIRERRNIIVHDLLSTLSEGLTEEDAKMIIDLLIYNRRINNWVFRNQEMEIMNYKTSSESSIEDVVGYDDTVLIGIFNILFCNEGKKYKEELEKLKNETSV